jgi:molybdate transport system substrate-binding protein
LLTFRSRTETPRRIASMSFTASRSPGFRRRLIVASALASLGAPAGLRAAGDPPIMAAASDLKFALDDLIGRFQHETGLSVRPVYGSSGQLFTQLQQGAPFELFLSADEAYVLRLADAGLTRDRGRLYALGRIGLLVPQGSPLRADPDLQDLAAALTDGRLKKFAIAHPDHAPYGARAREALQALGLWQRILPHLVLGENVSQAAQFVLSGAAQGGIVAQSLALAPPLAGRGRFVLLPDHLHQPLSQRMVLMKTASSTAARFHDFLTLPSAQALLQRYGFTLPRG